MPTEQGNALEAVAVRESLELLGAVFEPGDWICYDPFRADGRRWFTLADEDDAEQALRHAWRLNQGVGGANAYFGLNARRGEGQTGKEGTLLARCYAADFDGSTPGDALDRIRLARLPPPTAVVFSGNGTHAYWRLHEPEEHAEEWSRRMRWLAKALGSDVASFMREPPRNAPKDERAAWQAGRKAFLTAVHAADAAICDWQRVLRLPGFTNRKEDYRAAPPVARIIECDPRRRFSWRDLEPKCDAPAEEPAAERPARRAAPEGVEFPGDAYARLVEWSDVLPAGWARVAAGRDADSWSMAGRRGRKTASILSKTDTLFVWDSDCPLPHGKPLGKFAVFTHLHHGGDFKAAHRALYEAGYGTRYADYPDVLPEAARTEEIPTAAELEVVDQDEARRRLAEAVAEKSRSPGVWLLAGQTGVGKSFATCVDAAERHPCGVTSAPTHALAGELADVLRAVGVADVGTYPKLTEATCQAFDDASAARDMGLPPRAVVCPICPHKESCEYLRLAAEADEADYRVVTHDRLKRQGKKLLENVTRLVIEEDAARALVSRYTLTAGDIEDFVYLAKGLAADIHRETVRAAAGEVVEATEWSDPFAEWAPPPSSPAASSVFVPPLAPEDYDRFATSARRLKEWGLYAMMLTAAELLRLGQQMEAAKESGVFSAQLAWRNPWDDVKRPEQVIWRVAKRWKLRLPPAVVPFVRALTGYVTARIVVEELPARPDAPKPRHATAIVIERHQLPAGIPVWINDGTFRVDDLRAMVPNTITVEDATPEGRMAAQHEAVQVLEDFYQPGRDAGDGDRRATAVADMIAAIARERPEKQRVGIITLMAYHKALLERDDSPLPADVRERVTWSTYFGRGDDRGSNDVIEACDLLVVIGTPCPPPKEIRAWLLCVGRLEAAERAGAWGDVLFKAGGDVWAGRGYTDPEWAEAAQAITRAALVQAVGRARATVAEGCSVVAVTREPLGLPVVASPITATDGAREAVEAVRAVLSGRVSDAPECKDRQDDNGKRCDTRATFPTVITIAKVARVSHHPPGATFAEVHAQLASKLGAECPSARTIKRWLSRAVTARMLTRIGPPQAAAYVPATGPAERPESIGETVSRLAAENPGGTVSTAEIIEATDSVRRTVDRHLRDAQAAGEVVPVVKGHYAPAGQHATWLSADGMRAVDIVPQADGTIIEFEIESTDGAPMRLSE